MLILIVNKHIEILTFLSVRCHFSAFSGHFNWAMYIQYCTVYVYVCSKVKLSWLSCSNANMESNAAPPNNNNAAANDNNAANDNQQQHPQQQMQWSQHQQQQQQHYPAQDSVNYSEQSYAANEFSNYAYEPHQAQAAFETPHQEPQEKRRLERLAENFPELSLMRRTEKTAFFWPPHGKGPKVGALPAFQALALVKEDRVRLRLVAFDGRRVDDEELGAEQSDSQLLSRLQAGAFQLCPGVSGDPDDLHRLHRVTQVHFVGDRLIARHRECGLLLRPRDLEADSPKCERCRRLEVDFEEAEDDDEIVSEVRNGLKCEAVIKQEEDSNNDDEATIVPVKHEVVENRSQMCPACRKTFDSVSVFTQHLIRCQRANDDDEADVDVDFDYEDVEDEEESEADFNMIGWTSEPMSMSRGPVHHLERRHKCNKCGKKYSSVLPFRKHQRRCTGLNGKVEKPASTTASVASSYATKDNNLGPRQCHVCLREIQHMFSRHFAQHEEHLDLTAVVKCPRCPISLPRLEINRHFQVKSN